MSQSCVKTSQKRVNVEIPPPPKKNQIELDILGYKMGVSLKSLVAALISGAWGELWLGDAMRL